MRIIANQNNGPVQLHTVIANTIVVCSNTADSGNLVYSELATTGEYANVIKGCVITKICWGGPETAYWTVKRQDHFDENVNAIVGVFSGTGILNYGSTGQLQDDTPTYDIILTPNGTGSANSYIMLEVKKIYGIEQTPV
jgi:hypothetical protein